MASHSLTLLLLCLSLLCISGKSDSVQAATSFIRSRCRKTTFPAVCIQSLSNFAPSIQNNPKQLAQTALSVSITRAQSSRAFVTKLAKFKGLKRREYAAIKDCLEEMADSVDRLSSSLQELKKMDRARGEEIFWHISNAQTWVSASLTDDNTCMDGFAGRALNGKIKSSVNARMTNVAQVTSNALALINQCAGNYK
ncbi:OLC1v1027215C1 [Oldenlandia corymbosa var. corymbosa]|uniref:OLC1v1027215C1 n=1 Tax=Oldenlandia corymbosa var. corymbosa TaxID=529605 RepID=A0AAV1CBZ0_OLDCO|nr:OLC1v1027215C1 [Oldenlandia corymbosa var. corymbosa]